MLWFRTRRADGVPDNVLAPLSALKKIESLELAYYGDTEEPWTPLVAWPALPDCPALTRLELASATMFVPVGSDAALARLRHVKFLKMADSKPTHDDPFYLRAAHDTGTWKPERLSSVCELTVTHSNPNTQSSFKPPRPKSRPGAAWKPIAHQVTKLSQQMPFGDAPPQTALAAGLGVLTSLRSLSEDQIPQNFGRQAPPIDLARLRAPDLTRLATSCSRTPLDAAQFPRLEVAEMLQVWPRVPPVLLPSLAGRARLTKLHLFAHPHAPPIVNLAELFAGGDGLPALTELAIGGVMLEWNVLDLPDAPTAREFASFTWDWLPRLVRVGVRAVAGREVATDVLAYMRHLHDMQDCAAHVVPALRRLHRGPALKMPAFA